MLKTTGKIRESKEINNNIILCNNHVSLEKWLEGDSANQRIA
jgi:hypothetical protein